MIKKVKERFNKPTPKVWRRIGNVLLLIAATSIPTSFSRYEDIAEILFIIGVGGKFLTTLFVEDEA